MQRQGDNRSPLRYPGSKHGLVDYLEAIINENLLTGAHFYELYAGSATVSVQLLQRGIISRATILERDPLIYAFWKSVVTEPEALCERINRVSVTLQTWKRFRKYLAAEALRKYKLLDLGLAGLFFNRTNFSGIIDAGPIGGMSQESEYKIDCRFNKKTIVARISSMARFGRFLTVLYGDALQYLHRNRKNIVSRHSFVYLDPPYYLQGKKLYRYHYSDVDHERLASFIKRERFPWIVSYDNHPRILAIFAGGEVVPIHLDYTVKESRKVAELLISNVRLIPPVYEANGKRYHSGELRSEKCSHRTPCSLVRVGKPETS